MGHAMSDRDDPYGRIRDLEVGIARVEARIAVLEERLAQWIVTVERRVSEHRALMLLLAGSVASAVMFVLLRRLFPEII